MSPRESYRAKGDSCPSCQRTPNVRFSRRQVERCRLDRASGNHTQVHCQRCGRKYWIRNVQIAEARPARPTAKRNGNGRPETNGRSRRRSRSLPSDFPAVGALREAEIRTVAQLRAVEDLQRIPGVGPAREEEIRKALDAILGTP